MFVGDANALQLAIFSGDLGVFHSLVSTGADLEARLPYFQNQTPLHLAVEFLEVDMVKLLIEAGADVRATFDQVSVVSSKFAEIRSLGGENLKMQLTAFHQVRSRVRFWCS